MNIIRHDENAVVFVGRHDIVGRVEDFIRFVRVEFEHFLQVLRVFKGNRSVDGGVHWHKPLTFYFGRDHARDRVEFLVALFVKQVPPNQQQKRKNNTLT